MPRAEAIPIEIHALDPITGKWCERCSLPSGIEVPLRLVDLRTLQVISRSSWAQCQECGWTSQPCYCGKCNPPPRE